MSNAPSDPAFSSLIDLFDATDIHEKGIEKVYDYLLQNKFIEDPKVISKTLQLSLKRIYKIFSVLKEVGLVQVYSRPMKVMINPPITGWERIISEKIKELRQNLNEKVQICEDSFKDMQAAYNLKPENVSLPPVEFIALTGNDPIEYISSLLSAEEEVLMTKATRYHCRSVEKLIQLIHENKNIDILGFDSYENMISIWKNKIQDVHVKILVSEEYIEEVSTLAENISKNQTINNSLTKEVFKKVEIKIIDEAIINFIIKDKQRLLQFSIDPSNTLLGLFVSRQEEIVDVFYQKFNGFYKEAQNLDDFFKKKYKRAPTITEWLLLTIF